MSTNQNPYEIRLQILRMSKEMLDAKFEFERQEWLNKLDANKNVLQADRPEMYDPEDIVANASSLYKFVSDKS